MKLRWILRAVEDVIAIRDCIGKRSERYAEVVYERIMARPEQLLNHSQSGAMVPEYQRADIREVLFIPADLLGCR